MTSERKAVSVIFYSDDSYYIIKRQNFLRAFPGYTAFPGGKVDEDDFTDDFELSLLNTVRREILEELQFDIESQEVVDIRPIGLATSPDFNPKRYETYFFLITLNKKIDFTYTVDEFSEAYWISADLVIDQYNKGERLIVRPVLEIIKRLARNDFSYYNLDLLKNNSDIPSIEPLRDLIQLMPLSNTLYPATRTNCFVIGSKGDIIVDPSPKNEEEFSFLYSKLTEYNISKIFITHHHRDHHQYSNIFARKLKVPMFMSEFTFNQIKSVHGDDYFFEIEVVICQEGDILGRWLNHDVVVHEIPGHDKGQLGLSSSNLAWFIAGDLFQGLGTVVIGGYGSSMREYMDSLRKVISLNPACVIPSHGIALGGTNILEKTLAHRKVREGQIIDLIKQNKSKDEILKVLYSNIPKEILRYAMDNIESHMDKIKEENLLD